MKEKLDGLNKTGKITNAIKEYTEKYIKDTERNKIVLSNRNGGEFLYDVSVVNFNPKQFIKKRGKSIVIDNEETIYSSFLLLESELGGPRGSSAIGVFRNVVEDFLKLIIGNSKYKIMIMAVSKYKGEENFVKNRIDILREIYLKSECNSDILIIAIEGYHKRDKTQIKLDTKKMHYEILSRE